MKRKITIMLDIDLARYNDEYGEDVSIADVVIYCTEIVEDLAAVQFDRLGWAEVVTGTT